MTDASVTKLNALEERTKKAKAVALPRALETLRAITAILEHQAGAWDPLTPTPEHQERAIAILHALDDIKCFVMLLGGLQQKDGRHD